MVRKSRKKPRQPQYRRQSRPGGRDVAFVQLANKRHYLGDWNTPESRKAYHKILAEWEAAGRKPPAASAPAEEAEPPADLTILELCNDYRKHTDKHPSIAVRSRVKMAIKPVAAKFGELPAAKFGPNALRIVRETWIAEDLAHRTISHYTKAIRGMFKWAVGRELVSASVRDALKDLEPLDRHESRQTDPVGPAPIEHVEKAKALLSKPLAALVELQLLTGARPGELLGLRPIDIDTTMQPWEFRPAKHKTAYRAKRRIIYFGPSAQKVLGPYLAGRPTHAPLFSPKDAVADRAAEAPTHRRENQKPNECKTGRILGEQYTKDSYRRAVDRACKAAGVPTWHPNQLRHSAATYLRKHFGLEAAAVVLGHSSALVTEAVYAERDEEKTRSIVAKIG